MDIQDVNVIINAELIARSGDFQDMRNCPLATFMQEATGDSTISCGYWSIIGIDTSWILTPKFDDSAYENAKNGTPFVGIAKKYERCKK